MGLKISYALTLPGDASVATQVIDVLHARALTMRFDVVSRVRRRGPGQWSSAELLTGTCYFRPRPRGRAVQVPPVEGAWFSVYVDGAEDATIGLATRPALVAGGSGSRQVATKLDGTLAWQGSCKTQYAALPEFGGIDNFLRAHICLVDLLDAAADLGVGIEAHDDGGYAKHHDAAQLLEALGSWDRMVAAMAAYLKENVDESIYGPLAAPILSHPDYERLAAEGRKEMEAERAAARRERSSRRRADGRGGPGRGGAGDRAGSGERRVARGPRSRPRD